MRPYASEVQSLRDAFRGKLHRLDSRWGKRNGSRTKLRRSCERQQQRTTTRRAAAADVKEQVWDFLHPEEQGPVLVTGGTHTWGHHGAEKYRPTSKFLMLQDADGLYPWEEGGPYVVDDYGTCHYSWARERRKPEGRPACPTCGEYGAMCFCDEYDYDYDRDYERDDPMDRFRDDQYDYPQGYYALDCDKYDGGWWNDPRDPRVDKLGDLLWRDYENGWGQFRDEQYDILPGYDFEGEWEALDHYLETGEMTYYLDSWQQMYDYDWKVIHDEMTPATPHYLPKPSREKLRISW